MICRYCERPIRKSTGSHWVHRFTGHTSCVDPVGNRSLGTVAAPRHVKSDSHPWQSDDDEPEEEYQGPSCLFTLLGMGACALLFVLFIWFVATMFAWLDPYPKPVTLLEVLIAQWHWLRSLRVW